MQQSSPGTIPDFQVGGFVSDQALGWVRSKGVSLALSYSPYFEKKNKVYETTLLPMWPPQETETVEAELTFIAQVELCKYFPAETNIKVTIEEILDTAIFMRYVFYPISSM